MEKLSMSITELIIEAHPDVFSPEFAEYAEANPQVVNAFMRTANEKWHADTRPEDKRRASAAAIVQRLRWETPVSERRSGCPLVHEFKISNWTVSYLAKLHAYVYPARLRFFEYSSKGAESQKRAKAFDRTMMEQGEASAL
jgi:hypothetical protein